MKPIRAFECNVKGTEWYSIINHTSHAKAKYEYLRRVQDAWENVKYTDIRCRSLGPPISSERFKANAKYRGLPDVRCGNRVRVGRSQGIIVGHDDSCNFEVLFDDADVKYPGLKLSVHPSELVLVEDKS